MNRLYMFYTVLGMLCVWNMPLGAVLYETGNIQQNRIPLSILEDRNAPTSRRAVMRPQDFQLEMTRYVNTLFGSNPQEIRESISRVSDGTRSSLLGYVNTIDPSTLSPNNVNQLNVITNALQDIEGMDTSD